MPSNRYFLPMAAATALALTLACLAQPARAGAPDHKQEVIDLFKSFETGEPGPLRYINADNYIQHNLSNADGLAGLKALLAILPKGRTKVHSVRVFQDGDFVFVHNQLDVFGPKITFDILRYENGKIVEHWDNIQTTPAQPNANGHGMVDGPTAATDIADTVANKALIRAYSDDLVHKRRERLKTYIDGANYIEHKPSIPDGGAVEYTKVAMVLGEGNFVLAAGEGDVAGKPAGLFDLYRIDGGKIVEHWGNVEAIPPRAAWKNPNGKF